VRALQQLGVRRARVVDEAEHLAVAPARVVLSERLEVGEDGLGLAAFTGDLRGHAREGTTPRAGLGARRGRIKPM
jgi:hypothetical protein